MTPSESFSLSLIMNIPKYSGTTYTLTHPLINSRCNMGIVLYFMINFSLLLYRRRNSGSFNISNTSMPLTNRTRLAFFWRILSSLCLICYLVPFLILLSFRIPQITYLCLFLLFLPLQSQLRSPLVSVFTKPRKILPPKIFRVNICLPWCSSFSSHTYSTHSI